MQRGEFGRRDFLKILGMTALGTASGCARAPAAAATSASPLSATAASWLIERPEPARKKRVLRIALMTDWHIRPERVAPDGMRLALRRAQAEQDPPDMIFNAGDSVMDSLVADKPSAVAQWDCFNGILKSECKLPIVHAIGNHDVWGWGMRYVGVQGDPLYGKAMAIEKLGIPNRYYSFNRAGWHFVVLDSTHTRNIVSRYAYIGMLDDEQYAWLVADVGHALVENSPICILSHIPILAASEYFNGHNERFGNWVVPASLVHIDARRLRECFLRLPAVRLCLSGHTHQYEVLDYLGVRYLTGGAVSGNWWDGAYLNFPPAYVMVNLYDDGSSDSTFVAYQQG